MSNVQKTVLLCYNCNRTHNNLREVRKCYGYYVFDHPYANAFKRIFLDDLIEGNNV